MFNYDNIGGKIKTLAKTICVIGVILSFIIGVIWFFGGIISLANSPPSNDHSYASPPQVSGGILGGGGGGVPMIIMGIIAAVVGSLFSWIASFVLYGFGELVETNAKIANKVAKEEFAPEPTKISSPKPQVQPQAKPRPPWTCSHCKKIHPGHVDGCDCVD